MALTMAITLEQAAAELNGVAREQRDTSGLVKLFAVAISADAKKNLFGERLLGTLQAIGQDWLERGFRGTP